MRQDKKVRYLKKMHYKNLVKMCKRTDKNIEDHAVCPLEYAKLQHGEDYSNDPCSVCRAFIQLRKTRMEYFDGPVTGESIGLPLNCPCLVLGIDEAMRRTRSAVKTYKKRGI